MHILCIALRYDKQNKPENHKTSYLLCFFNETSALVLFLGFRYFELQNIYKRILNHIKIPMFSSEFVHRQWNGSCTIYIVCFSPNIEQRKQFYNCEANNLGAVWCSGQIVYVLTDAC